MGKLHRKPDLVPELKQIPMGMPKSGRVWKDRTTKRFSTVKQGTSFHTSWEEKQRLKQEMKLVKQRDRELKDANKQRIDERKKRRAEKIKMREENSRKAEIGNRITNIGKLRKLSKRQMSMRNIVKR